MGNKYTGTTFDRIVSSGGSVRVTIASNIGRGNGGTSIPCKGCFVSPASANSAAMRVNIGAAASATVGIGIPDVDQGGPTYIPIDDVASLYFYGTDQDICDILYLLG
jgi:hypothetical protein